jgi:hypothetical protein
VIIGSWAVSFVGMDSIPVMTSTKLLPPVGSQQPTRPAAIGFDRSTRAVMFGAQRRWRPMVGAAIGQFVRIEW